MYITLSDVLVCAHGDGELRGSRSFTRLRRGEVATHRSLERPGCKSRVVLTILRLDS